MGKGHTCVAVEYRFHNGHNFGIDVDLFGEEDMEMQIKTLLRHYRQYHDRQTPTREDRNEDLVYTQKMGRLARTTLSSMFHGRISSSDDWLSKDSPGTPTAVSILCGWAREVMTTLETRATASTPEECAGILDKLTTETTSTHGIGVWPYIRKVRLLALSLPYAPGSKR